MLVVVESELPTAHTLFGVSAATAESTLESTFGCALGLEVMDQLMPFQCSISVWGTCGTADWRLPQAPTAQTLLGATTATPPRKFSSCPGWTLALLTTCQ